MNTEPPVYSNVLASIGMCDRDVPGLIRAESYSLKRLRSARTALSCLPEAMVPGMASFALGSLGRREASSTSDLDFAFLFDSERVSYERASRMRRRCIQTLERSFDIPEKTFRDVINSRTLIRNVGGADDSNTTLTYRALLLTEGAWLHNSIEAENIRRTLFSIYARGEKSRGKFLNSLANDLHRYYRTLCVDYRFKVEEQDKTWAIRVLKLRHSRKLWHLANVVLQCWSSDLCASDGARERVIWEHLHWPPLLRLTVGMRHFSGEILCAPVIRAHDRFLDALASPAVREELGRLPYSARNKSAIFVSLHENAARMDEASGRIVEHLLGHCRDYLLRFCLL